MWTLIYMLILTYFMNNNSLQGVIIILTHIEKFCQEIIIYGEKYK